MTSHNYNYHKKGRFEIYENKLDGTCQMAEYNCWVNIYFDCLETAMYVIKKKINPVVLEEKYSETGLPVTMEKIQQVTNPA